MKLEIYKAHFLRQSANDLKGPRGQSNNSYITTKEEWFVIETQAIKSLGQQEKTFTNPKWPRPHRRRLPGEKRLPSS